MKRFLEQLVKNCRDEYAISMPDSIAADTKRSELEEKIRLQQQIVDRLQQQQQQQRDSGGVQESLELENPISEASRR